jgi:hypothetical protein
MKIGELLRQLADMVDAEESNSPESPEPGGCTPDLNAQADTGESPDEIYVGPLQQKHELLKKATGVENNVDQFAADDEIAQMQQNAGIQQPTTIINQTIEVVPGAQQPAPKLDTAIISPLSDLTDTD